MFQWMEKALLKKGLKKYEISNFAMQGRQSRHNSAYWEGKNVLGFGLSAHSYLKTRIGHSSTPPPAYGIRFWNSPHLKTYTKQAREVCEKSPLDNLPSSQKEILKLHEALTDFCHTRLRRKAGFSLGELFSLFPREVEQKILPQLVELKALKYLKKTGEFFHLTTKGELLSNPVFLQLTFLEKDFSFLSIPHK